MRKHREVNLTKVTQDRESKVRDCSRCALKKQVLIMTAVTANVSPALMTTRPC